jgi:hypothetical protein
LTSDPDIVTTYAYDVHDNDPLENYASFNNRLMSYEVEQDSTVLERTWYAYNRGGQVKRIVTEYPDDDEDYYYVRVLQYNTANQLWLIRGFEIDAECGEENANVTALYAREFRYDGDRARYAVIERDPEDMEPTGATWHEYVGDNICCKDP